jgi:hypothetical protein
MTEPGETLMQPYYFRYEPYRFPYGKRKSHHFEPSSWSIPMEVYVET